MSWYPWPSKVKTTVKQFGLSDESNPTVLSKSFVFSRWLWTEGLQIDIRHPPLSLQGQWYIDIKKKSTLQQHRISHVTGRKVQSLGQGRDDDMIEQFGCHPMHPMWSLSQWSPVFDSRTIPTSWRTLLHGFCEESLKVPRRSHRERDDLVHEMAGVRSNPYFWVFWLFSCAALTAGGRSNPCHLGFRSRRTDGRGWVDPLPSWLGITMSTHEPVSPQGQEQ